MPSILDPIGSFRLAARSGACTGIAAGGAIFAFRWTDTVAKARIRAIEVAHLVTTGYTAAQEVGYEIISGRTWTVAPSGGTALTLTTNNGKLNVTSNSTRIAGNNMRIATTGALTNGTVTIDTQPFAVDSVWSLAGAAGAAIGWNRPTLEFSEPSGLILATNEGFLVRNTVAQGAAGVGTWFVNVQWDEVLIG